MSITAKPPFQYFTDAIGEALESGKIYVGVAGLDAEANPITVYWNSAATVVAAQPIRTIGGAPDNSGTPSDFFTEANYSITVRDKNDVLVYSKLQLNANDPELLEVSLNVLTFGAIGDGVTDDTAAIQAANTAAVSEGRALYFPAGEYLYAPSAKIDLTAPWEGDDDVSTIIQCDATAYSGVFFRLITGSIKNLRIRNKDVTKTGTGVQLAAADVDAFTAHIRLGPQFTVVGFDKNIDVHNTYQVVFDQVRSQFGNEGFYCAPLDVVGDNGYSNTHLHLNCFYDGNVRNIYYSPALGSQSIVFVGGSNQGSTGSAQQAFFKNIGHLNISSWYCEGAAGIPAIELESCHVIINGLFMSGTGGIDLGTSANQLELTNVRGATATDVLNIAPSANTVKANLTDVSLPSSGNDISGIDFGTIRTSFINGNSYNFSAFGSGRTHLKFPSAAILSTDPNTFDDYEEGLWTPVLSFATPGDLSVAYSLQVGRYTKKGNEVTAHFQISTSSFTHTTASGFAQISGLLHPSTNLTGLNPIGALVWGGITKAGYTNIAAYMPENLSYLQFRASGSGQPIAGVSASDMPTGGSVSLRGTLIYQTDS